ncbi:MAG: putative rane protein, partial [Planctomycetota bacterium]|nr:putative rane protein [Planctomycetota bacterium]
MLGNLSVTFGNAWWLIAIPLFVPPLIAMSIKSLSGLGKVRQAIAILFRTTVVTLIILALAQIQAVRRNDKLTTIFLLDRSESIPTAPNWGDAMLSYVNAAIKNQKRTDDLAGVIVFGKEPKVESPPSLNPPQLNGIENVPDPEYSDLSAAIKLALASFPEDTARRLVVLSDGNDNRGNALEQALAAAGLKVQIDVLPIEYRYEKEVLVEKVSLPPEVKQGETVNINVVIRASEPTKGKLQIFQKADNYSAPLTEQPVEIELQRGINVHSLKQTITQPSFYTYTAEFIPDQGSGDRRANNNSAIGFVQARGEANVLLIEGTRGEHEELVSALRAKGLRVDVKVAPRIDAAGIVGGDQLPSDIAQLQPYDTVILGNVPKDSFTEDQIKILESNCHDMGAGLVMLGGPNSFGAGGWMNTPVEKALPVDMQIKAMKVMGKSALVMVMHASEIPEGNYWQKVVSQEALKTLSPYDYAGMLHWEGQEAWLFTLQPIGEKKGTMLRAIDKMTPGDMPDVDPSLIMGINALKAKTDAMTKHFIVISDGDPTPPTRGVINQLVANKITVTSILVASHGGDRVGPTWMQDLATKTKGRFYNVTNPRALPRIYQKEARLISRPLIFERPQPWAPTIQSFTEPTLGLPNTLPGITGLVLTQLKENELVELPLTSAIPTGQTNPLLAHWTYGLGRSVAWTSDAGRKWAKAWPNWENYAAFWSQVIRWSLRPVDNGNMNLSLRREDGKIKVVIDALDKQNQFLNYLDIQGNVVNPEFKGEPLILKQTAPGRYEGTVEKAEARGNYFVNLGARGADGKMIFVSGGVSVPYSDEYRELKSNPEKLAELASYTDGKVLSWKFQKDGRIDLDRTLNEADVFRRDPKLTPPSSFTDL